MKTIPLREFQQNAKKYINKLPVILSRYNKPVAMVFKYKKSQVVEDVTTSNIEEATPPVQEKSKWPSTYLGKPISGNKATCPICYESVPVEFAQIHYAKDHADI